MSCDKIKELIPLYIHGELDRDSAAEVVAHIECCEECKKEYRLWLNIKNDVHEAAFEPPTVLKKRIDYEVSRQAKAHRLRKIFTATAAIAASVIIVFSSAISLGRTLGGGSDKAPAPTYTSPDLDLFTSYISLSSDTVSDKTDSEINRENLTSFSGDWTATLKNGDRLVLTINNDGSAVACIKDKWGIENYYDGEIIFNRDSTAVFTQSDGITDGVADIVPFYKDGRIYICVVSGSIPWISQ